MIIWAEINYATVGMAARLYCMVAQPTPTGEATCTRAPLPGSTCLLYSSHSLHRSKNPLCLVFVCVLLHCAIEPLVFFVTIIVKTHSPLAQFAFGNYVLKQSCLPRPLSSSRTISFRMSGVF